MQQQTTLERPKNGQAVANKDPNELKLAGNFNLTEDEVEGGMDEGGQGYLDQYPFRIRLSQSDFEVIDTKTEQKVWVGRELPGIIHYGHSVYRLHRGTVEGLPGDRKTWPEDMQEVVAMSFGSPFGEAQKSRGNFDANGYGQYLDNKELRKLVKKRLYLFLRLPQKVNGGALAAATFGGSALIPFGAYHSKIKGMNSPLPLVKSVLYTEKAKNENDEEYSALRIRPLLDAEGNIATSVPTDEEYRKNIKPVLDQIIETHKFAMKRLEGQSVIERTVSSSGQPAAIAAPAPKASAAAFEMSPGKEDSVPGAFSDDELEF